MGVSDSPYNFSSEQYLQLYLKRKHGTSPNHAALICFNDVIRVAEKIILLFGRQLRNTAVYPGASAAVATEGDASQRHKSERGRVHSV